MKILVSTLIPFLLSCAQANNTFKVVEVPNKNSMAYHLKHFSTDKRYYKISFNEKGNKFNHSYPVDIQAKSLDDTISAIKKLLEFEGDARVTDIPVMNWNLESSNLYTEDEKLYSIQVEALFIINQLYYKAPFLRSPLPVLENKIGETATIKGDIINKAYKSYKIWFKSLKKEDFRKSDFKKPNPLMYTDVKWL